MIQHTLGLIDNLSPGLSDFQTKVHIFKPIHETLIKTIDGVEIIFSNKETCRGHRLKFLANIDRLKIGRNAIKNMVGSETFL